MPNAGTTALSRQSTSPALSPTIVSTSPTTACVDEVAVEERLRDPGRALVGLVDEVEERLPALGLRSQDRRGAHR